MPLQDKLSYENITNNLYLTKKAHFDCGITRLAPAQEEVLSKISKSILLMKLGLSKKSPYKVQKLLSKLLI